MDGRRMRSSGWQRIRSAADDMEGVLSDLDGTTMRLLHDSSDDSSDALALYYNSSGDSPDDSSDSSSESSF